MSYENEYANLVHPTELIAAGILEAFVKSDVVFPYVQLQVLTGDTKTAVFTKAGKVEGQVVAEGGNYSVTSDSELTDTPISVTAEKLVQAMKVTAEQINFPGKNGGWSRIGREQGKALNRLAATKLKGLFAATTNAVTASSVATKDNLFDCRYYISAAMKDTISEKLVAYLSYKSVNALQKELTSITSGWSAQADLGILGISTGGRPVGELLDIVVYQTDGLSTSGADDVQQVWDPAAAFCAVVNATEVFNNEVIFVGSQGISYESTSWYYAKFAQLADTAACKLLSDT